MTRSQTTKDWDGLSAPNLTLRAATGLLALVYCQQAQAQPQGAAMMTTVDRVWLVSDPYRPDATILRKLPSQTILELETDLNPGPWVEVHALDALGGTGWVAKRLLEPAGSEAAARARVRAQQGWVARVVDGGERLAPSGPMALLDAADAALSSPEASEGDPSGAEVAPVGSGAVPAVAAVAKAPSPPVPQNAEVGLLRTAPRASSASPPTATLGHTRGTGWLEMVPAAALGLATILLAGLLQRQRKTQRGARIEVQPAVDMGGGRSLVTVRANGQWVLLGVTAKTLTAIRTWDPRQEAVDPERAEEPAPAMADSAAQGPHLRARAPESPPDKGPQSAPRASLRPRAGARDALPTGSTPSADSPRLAEHWIPQIGMDEAAPRLPEGGGPTQRGSGAPRTDVEVSVALAGGSAGIARAMARPKHSPTKHGGAPR
jgi:flagellar biogenesis protein FliO